MPYSDWSAPNSEIIRGGSLLDVHGPIFFAVLSVVTPKLIPELGEAIGAVNNADDIKSVMQRHVRWTSPTSGKVKQTYLMGWRLFSLLDYLLPKAPYFGYQRYNTRVDAHTRESFLAFSEKQHKENMDDFEAIWLLQITKAAAKPATGRKTTSTSGALDLIARMQGAPKAAGGRGSSADRSSPP